MTDHELMNKVENVEEADNVEGDDEDQEIVVTDEKALGCIRKLSCNFSKKTILMQLFQTETAIKGAEEIFRKTLHSKENYPFLFRMNLCISFFKNVIYLQL